MKKAILLTLGLLLGGGIAYAFTKKRDTLSKNGIGIAKFLISKGYSKHHASGIAGNIYVESKYDPLAVGDNGYSFGLAQWHKDRWDQLNSFAKKNKLNPNTIEAQLLYLDWELKNGESNAYNMLLSSKTPYESAYNFAKYFERPSVISPLRMEKSIEIYNQL